MTGKVFATHLAEMPVHHEGLVVTFCYDLVDERLVVTEMRVIAEQGGSIALGSRPPFARLAARALVELRTRWAPQVLHHQPSETAVAAAEALLEAPGARVGRPPLYDSDHWAEVAAVAKEGGTLAVAERYSLSYATAWKWCRQAAQSLA
jgi:hypothetical protein